MKMAISKVPSQSNKGKNPGFEPSSLVELLQWRAAQNSGDIAYTFLVNGEAEELSLTYKELDHKARIIAKLLQDRRSEGERVLLLFPPGLEYINAFFGCLYAGAIAVPAYPPKANRNLEKIEAFASDSRAAVALTTKLYLKRIERHLNKYPGLMSLQWITTDELTDEFSPQWRDPGVTSNTLAFIQYTSGSTSSPKGVMLTHNNLLHNERLIKRAFKQSERSIIVSWLPLYHDMGLIGCVLQSLYTGARCILMPPAAFLQRPVNWLKAISNYNATTSGGPNFAYDLCALRIDPDQRMGIDLSSWKVAFNGSEPVRAETMKRFADTFASYGFQYKSFFPCYGLAEATLFVCGKAGPALPVSGLTRRKSPRKKAGANTIPDRHDVGGLVGYDLRSTNQKVVVVKNETLSECASNDVGEIWIAGPSVAEGYWNRPDLSESIFHAKLAPCRDESYLRTGDLGFIHEGKLFISGRLKDVIIIRGVNYYPHDIEWTAELCHRDLLPGCNAAFDVQIDGEPRVVLVQEVKHPERLDLDMIIRAVREAVSEAHGIELFAIALVRAHTVPKTTNGKVQRYSCRQAFLAGKLEALNEWREEVLPSGEIVPSDLLNSKSNNVEYWLTSKLAKRVGLTHDQIEIDQAITRYCSDSLLIIGIAHDIEAEYGVRLAAANLLEADSIADLVAAIQSQIPAHSAAQKLEIIPAENPPLEYPLSAGQQSLWFLDQLETGGAACNVWCAVRLQGSLDAPALKRAFQALLARHTSLRVTINTVEGRLFQRVREKKDLFFRVENVSSWGEEDFHQHLLQVAYSRFDLEEGPLFKVYVFIKSSSEQVLLLVAHHIIIDFWSFTVLMHELRKLYAAEVAKLPATLDPVQLSYSDYVRWQSELLSSAEGDRLWNYWQKELAGDLAVLNLPLDRQRPRVQTYRGASRRLRLSSEVTQELKRVASAQGVTLYMVLLAAFQALLCRYTGQEEIRVGVPTSGRGREELRGLVGYFVNLLVIRTFISQEVTFVHFLNQVRRTVLEAFKHEEFPLPTLMERMQLQRNTNYPPLFQVTFAMQKSHLAAEAGLEHFTLGEVGASARFGDLIMNSISLERLACQSDISLTVTELGDGILELIDFNIDLFDPTTIYRFQSHLQALIESIVKKTTESLCALSLLTEAERSELLVARNLTKVNYQQDRRIHELFEGQVDRTPDAIAVVHEQGQVSYDNLNAGANKLAHYLIERGVGPELVVGICLERGIEMVIALLAVIKAGGAYLPLDVDYPEKRLALMLKDSNAKLLLTCSGIYERLKSCDREVLLLDRAHEIISCRNFANPEPVTTPDASFYVIYTSGSTGDPKGVVISQGALLNHMQWMQDCFPLNENDRVLQKTPFGFDASVWEFYAPLLAGSCLVLARHSGHQDPCYLVETAQNHMATIIQVVPTLLRALVKEELSSCASLRRVFIGGESLSSDLVEATRAAINGEIVNLYGPTEATIDASYWKCNDPDAGKAVAIGRPISNMEMYVLDRALEPVPEALVGELYIAGRGLARGYVGRADATAERFMPNLYDNEAGRRLYRTGDLGKWTPDRSVEFIGRADGQIKIRGYRIELGEIEAALNEYPGIKAAAALAVSDKSGERRLVAYIAPEHGALIDINEARLYLSAKLPQHMTPQSFVMIDKMPLTPGGKLDRRSLAALETPLAQPRKSYRAPSNDIEKSLAKIWEQALGVDHIAVDDNFFELGGHSLLAAQIVAQAHKLLSVNLPLRKIFEMPTIEELSKVVADPNLASTNQKMPKITAVPRDLHYVGRLSQSAVPMPEPSQGEKAN